MQGKPDQQVVRLFLLLGSLSSQREPAAISLERKFFVDNLLVRRAGKAAGQWVQKVDGTWEYISNDKMAEIEQLAEVERLAGVNPTPMP